jgi:hypothetical protein
MSNMYRSHSSGNLRGDVGRCLMYMGPVSAAVVLYVAERFLSRIIAGQVLRKGVSRKLRRLRVMLTEWHVIYEVACDVLDDIPY